MRQEVVWLFPFRMSQSYDFFNQSELHPINLATNTFSDKKPSLINLSDASDKFVETSLVEKKTGGFLNYSHLSLKNKSFLSQFSPYICFKIENVVFNSY